MEYTLIRSKRKTITIYVRDGNVEVRAPLKTPKYEIDQFVASKEKWIKSRLAASSERLAQRKNFSLDYGDCVTYRSKQYPIVAKEGKRVGFDEERFYMPPEQIKAACVQIYRSLAKRDLTPKVLDFAKQMQVTPVAVKINGANFRWGSCSTKKSLNFSWRLIRAEDSIIDYVVVHELAHIIEMNHSERFWAIVDSVLPDFRERKAKLRMLQQIDSAEDWG